MEAQVGQLGGVEVEVRVEVGHLTVTVQQVTYNNNNVVIFNILGAEKTSAHSRTYVFISIFHDVIV